MIFNKLFKFLFLISFLFTEVAFAQIELTMPVNRMVYQRNKQNTANIYVGGNFSGQFDKIEARLTKLDGTGEPKLPLSQTEWLTIVNNPQKGNFLGTIANQQAAWYRLEVRAIQNGAPIGVTNTIKVGIGEVIVAAGQSNAVGDPPQKDKTLYGAADDRVNCINLNDFNTTAPLKYPVISHMEPFSLIAPTGASSWCWGPMGDLIAKNWDVPVIFFNTAIGGTSIFQWRASANNEFEAIGNLDTKNGVPFVHIQKTLNYYCSLMGIRTILWCQGENDNANLQNVGGDLLYKENLTQVIQQSRNKTNKDISWVVAKTSRARFENSDVSYTSFNVTNGQQLTIDIPNFNVFNGPNTDEIQPEFYDRDFFGVHFVGQGIKDLGKAWFNSINNNNFLLNSKPQPATPPQQANLGACVNNTQISAQLPNGFMEYSWYADNYANETKSQSVTATNGKVLIPYMKEATGKNYVFSPPISFVIPKLSIVTDRSPVICEGQTVNFQTNTFNTIFDWNTGSTNKAIPIKTAGNYTFTVNSKDIYGCTSSATGVFTVKVNALPPAPVLVSLGLPSICEGNNIILKPDKDLSLYKYIWNTTEVTPFISVTKSGKYNLSYKDNNNCESITSNTVEVVVNPNPLKPDVIAGGPTTFCADKFVSIATTNDASFEWELNKVLLKDFNTQFINASLPGQYRSRVINKYGCPSPYSDEIKITNYTLPQPPFITKSGPVAFCEGSDVELTANSAISNLFWSTNEKEVFSNDRTIKITSNRDQLSNSNITYYARVTDNIGCTSRPSEKVQVAIRANPSIHKIDAIGAFTLEAKTPLFGLEGATYKWYFNNNPLLKTDKIIKVNEPGNYQVISKILYTLPNSEKLACESYSSPIYNYVDQTNSLFAVYPNPSFDGSFTLETKSDFSGAQLLLYTPLGNLIMNQSVDLFNERKILDLKNLPNGEYKLKLKTSDGEVVKSIIISRK
jgi:Carbohydrate esterase, sialic acid-specific acetylesterase/Secretion system C-terminal sorting domain